MCMTSFLFSPPERQQEFQKRLEAQDPTALAMREALHNPPVDNREFDMSLQHLVLAWMEGDVAKARDAVGEVINRIPEPAEQDLGKAAQALGLGCAMNLAEQMLGEEDLEPLQDHCVMIARSFLEVSSGNPHIVTNNWYALTHGGCLLACLAADREDLAELETWATNRLRAFCHHFGSAGMYHEGTGYISYTLSMLFPVILALRNRRGLDLTEEFPSLRLSMRSMMMGTARHADEVHMLDWNDTGRGGAGLNPVLPGIQLALKEDQPALKTWFDRTLGVSGANRWHCDYRGLALAVATYPFDLPEADPNEVLPHWAIDSRQGLGWWRSRWGDGSESVFGFYARHAHMKPGHAQDDAASIRLMACGRNWICAGGQARAKAIWQSSLSHAEESERSKAKPFAYISSQDLNDAGGQLSMEMRHHLGAYSERYLSWRENETGAFQLAVFDQVDEHQDPSRPWTWNLSFPRELSWEVDEDQRGLTMTDPECGVLRLRFLLDAPTALTVEEMPGSTRTFAGGQKVDYPGDYYLAARLEDRKNLNILVAITVIPKGAPTPALTGTLNAISFGTEVWDQPFKGMILSSFDPALHRPNLQKGPAGLPLQR